MSNIQFTLLTFSIHVTPRSLFKDILESWSKKKTKLRHSLKLSGEMSDYVFPDERPLKNIANLT